MKSTLGAIALIGVVLGTPTLIALAAVASNDDGASSRYVSDQPGSEYHGPENFWAE